MQQEHALKAIDALLADLPFLRIIVEEAPYDGFQHEATPVIHTIEKNGRAT
jgi:hypothetical protein